MLRSLQVDDLSTWRTHLSSHAVWRRGCSVVSWCFPQEQFGVPPPRLMLLWAVLSKLQLLEGKRCDTRVHILKKNWSSQSCSAVLSTSASNLQLLYKPFLFVPGKLLSHYYRTSILALKTFLPVLLWPPKLPQHLPDWFKTPWFCPATSICTHTSIHRNMPHT